MNPSSVFLAWYLELNVISSASILLPAILALVLFKRQVLPLKSLSILIWIGALVEVAAQIMANNGKSNLPLLHVYVIIEFVLLGWMYQFNLYKLYNRYVIPIIIILFSIFSIINSLFIQSIYTFNTHNRPLSNLLLIVFAISYYYKLLKELKIRYLERNPMFWINTGILIYYSGSLFLFIFSNYIIKTRESWLLVWHIHSILNIFINIFYTIGLWHSQENSE
ncbi:MAG TPA: hypothetical protein DCS93_22850 [Microscillaceae bacterium]|nr:hypothetical protein [Microscillaceae bacterium]